MERAEEIEQVPSVMFQKNTPEPVAWLLYAPHCIKDFKSKMKKRDMLQMEITL